MNEDYLWDKSGVPDPEIQQLEEILGTLRYQPKPLRLAGQSSATRGRNYVALLAIAATVAVALLAGSLWLLLPKQEASIPSVAYVTPATPIPTPSEPVKTSYSPPKRKPVIIRHNNQEALAAKQQLMFALRLASEKLNAAYRRTQTPTQIKNQHRAG
jgi:hypothetical protein